MWRRSLKGKCEQTCVSAQGAVVHGAFGRALLAGGAALQPDERTAQPLGGPNVLQAQRPAAAPAPHAPAGRDQTPVGDQVGNTRLLPLGLQEEAEEMEGKVSCTITDLKRGSWEGGG